MKNRANGQVSKKVKKEITSEWLSAKYTPAKVIKIMSHKKVRHSKKYENKDYCDAMKLRNLGGRKVLKHVREELEIALPAKSTLQKKFSHIRIVPGEICKATLVALQHAKKSWTSTEYLGLLNHDEINTQKIAELDSKYDTVIGMYKWIEMLLWALIFLFAQLFENPLKVSFCKQSEICLL